MRRFRYWRDPLFLSGCAAYAINRWFIKPHVDIEVFHSQFNDFWLIPCALPPILWLYRKCGLRASDDMPGLSEIGWHLAFWSVLFEWIGPRIVPHAVGDFRDVVAYALGAIVAAVWWHRGRWVPVLSNA